MRAHNVSNMPSGSSNISIHEQVNIFAFEVVHRYILILLWIDLIYYIIFLDRKEKKNFLDTKNSCIATL